MPLQPVHLPLPDRRSRPSHGPARDPSRCGICRDGHTASLLCRVMGRLLSVATSDGSGLRPAAGCQPADVPTGRVRGDHGPRGWRPGGRRTEAPAGRARRGESGKRRRRRWEATPRPAGAAGHNGGGGSGDSGSLLPGGTQDCHDGSCGGAAGGGDVSVSLLTARAASAQPGSAVPQLAQGQACRQEATSGGRQGQHRPPRVGVPPPQRPPGAVVT